MLSCCEDWSWKKFFLKKARGPRSSSLHTHTTHIQTMHIGMYVHGVWMGAVGVWRPCCIKSPSKIDIKLFHKVHKYYMRKHYVFFIANSLSSRTCFAKMTKMNLWDLWGTALNAEALVSLHVNSQFTGNQRCILLCHQPGGQKSNDINFTKALIV